VDRGVFRALARQPHYVRFFGAATVARIADEMFSVGVVLLALERTGSATLAGAIVAAITIPSFFSAPLLGAWLDLHGRRRALMVFDQALASAVIVFIAIATGRVPDGLIVVTALLAGITWPLSFGGFTSLIPALVEGELLAPANALEATSLNIATIVGPLLAGGVAGAWSPEAAVLTEAGLTLAALGMLIGFEALDRGPTRAAGSLLEVARDGLRALVSVPALRGVSVAGMISLAGIGLLTVAFPFFCTEHLGAARSASGFLWAAFAVGSTVGALALVGLQRRQAPHRIVLGSLVVFGALMLTWPLAASLPVAVVLVAVASLADGPGLAGTFAVRQDWAPADLQGQIFTTGAGVKVGSFALGSAAAGPLVSGAGSSTALLVAAGLQIAAAAIGALAVRWRPAAVADLARVRT
jgi:MFS family permease